MRTAAGARGLTSAEVAQRVSEGKVNENADIKTRSIPRIFRDNICTLFNLVNVILAVAIFWTGSYRNLVFLAIILCNVVIGIFQEVRSKLTIDRLSVITSTKAHVIRDGKLQDIPLDEIVLDDIVELGRGDQVPSDCEREPAHRRVGPRRKEGGRQAHVGQFRERWKLLRPRDGSRRRQLCDEG